VKKASSPPCRGEYWKGDGYKCLRYPLWLPCLGVSVPTDICRHPSEFSSKSRTNWYPTWRFIALFEEDFEHLQSGRSQWTNKAVAVINNNPFELLWVIWINTSIQRVWSRSCPFFCPHVSSPKWWKKLTKIVYMDVYVKCFTNVILLHNSKIKFA
jgi:hypothetical protein